ncbi:MAG: hypothetical protein RML40_02610 [Bacteroidota bacterium]|nr:hypothetical protein [Candidatus Kapabacteria bacterium]MDW8219402.1 hypothetical protein [Bacteroidota bacterium]
MPSCTTVRKIEYEDRLKQFGIERRPIEVARTVTVKATGDPPIPGKTPVSKPDRIITFRSMNDKFEIKAGETVNIVYDGVNPEDTYLRYEPTEDGYIVQLASVFEPVNVVFRRLCELFIVANPAMTSVIVADNLRYEQIIWTPRADGSWEVRIGTTGDRNCRSQALDYLQRLRTAEYERNLRKYGKN